MPQNGDFSDARGGAARDAFVCCHPAFPFGRFKKPSFRFFLLCNFANPPLPVQVPKKLR